MDTLSTKVDTCTWRYTHPGGPRAKANDVGVVDHSPREFSTLPNSPIPLGVGGVVGVSACVARASLVLGVRAHEGGILLPGGCVRHAGF
jgi:hypothetical protein